MAFEGVDAGGSEGMFPQHPKTGDWETLKGRTLAPHIQAVLTSEAEGESRHQTDAVAQKWDSTVVVNTGLTRGGGTMAK